MNRNQLKTRLDNEASDQRRAHKVIGAANEFGTGIVKEVKNQIEYSLIMKFDQRPAMPY